MNSLSNIKTSGKLSGSWVSRFWKKVAKRIGGLFEPEEVEVTFKTKGKNSTYTYRKVDHKQVA